MTSSLVSIGSGDRHVLAVHGWFGSARGWGSLPEFLDRSTYTYAFMDLRGYGGRKQVAGEFTMEEAGADAITLADELGWDRFSVIGHSMGAKVAHQVLLQAPDRVDELVGLNPVPPTRCQWTSGAGSCSPAPRATPATGRRSSTSPPAAS